MSAAAAKVPDFVLSADEAVTLGWDVADPAPPPPPPIDPVNDPLFLGVVTASQRGVKGEVSLDVLLDPAGAWVEVGPLRFQRADAHFLQQLLIIAHFIMTQGAPLAPPWEGETRP